MNGSVEPPRDPPPVLPRRHHPRRGCGCGVAVSSGRNWDRARTRDRIGRQGSESASAGRPRAGARREADEADMVKRILKCPNCGHRGKIELPASMVENKFFRCTACGVRL